MEPLSLNPKWDDGVFWHIVDEHDLWESDDDYDDDYHDYAEPIYDWHDGN